MGRKWRVGLHSLRLQDTLIQPWPERHVKPLEMISGMINVEMKADGSSSATCQ